MSHGPLHRRRSRHFAPVVAVLLAASCAQAGAGVSEGNGMVSDRSGYGDYQPLVGTGALIEATVIEKSGPETVIAESGAILYPDRVDDESTWETPFGLPMIATGDVAVLRTFGGSAQAQQVQSLLQTVLDNREQIDILVPVGLYEIGATYRFWLSGWDDATFMSYLATDDTGAFVEGLDVQDLDAAISRLTSTTGLGREDSMVVLAEELNTFHATGTSSPLVSSLLELAPQLTVPSLNPEHYAVFEDELVDGHTAVPIEIYITGADSDRLYSVQGEKLLGWSYVNEDGLAAVRGWVPVGETLKLVSRGLDREEITVVDGSPLLTVLPGWEDAISVFSIDGADVELRSNVSLRELDSLTLPPGKVAISDVTPPAPTPLD